MKIIVATSNSHKLAEIKELLPESIQLLGLRDVGITESIPETGLTFSENALQKARFVYEKLKSPVIADDSGLEVLALDGRPGIYSARYSGENATDISNVAKLLREMNDQTERSARFVASIALIINGVEYVFEGFCNGRIALSTGGQNGFGYDPVFIPEGYELSFAELPPQVKNETGHRGKAIRKLITFLKDSGY